MSNRFDHTLEHKLKTKPDEADDAVVEVRRIEVITGTGRRRRWSADDKARILFESLVPGANVSEIARRHNVSPQQLFGWRRAVREQIGSGVAEVASAPAVPTSAVQSRRTASKSSGNGTASGNSVAPPFAPVVIAAPAASSAPSISQPCAPSPQSVIEIAIGDVVVRVSGQVEAQSLAAVLRVVRKVP